MAPLSPWGLAIAVPGGLLLLLLLCSFFPRASGRCSSRATGTQEPNPGVLSVVKVPEPGPNERGAAVAAALVKSKEPGKETQMLAGSRTDGTTGGDTGGLGGPPPSSPPRTPDFLRHRQLPLVPGEPQTPAAEPPGEGEGPIYESIRYKARKLSSGLRKPCGVTGDFGDIGDDPCGDSRDIGDDPKQGLLIQEEPCGEGSPCPVYARVRKAPRAPQRSQPHGPEPEEEAPPALPEKLFDELQDDTEVFRTKF